MNIWQNRNSLMVMAVLAALAFVVGGTVVYAGGERHGCSKERAGFHHSGKHHDKHLELLAGKLDLTEVQQQKIKGIFEVSREKMDDTHDQLRELGKQMTLLDPEAESYLKDVSRLARQKSELMEKQLIEQARVRHSIHKVLTPEQRETAEKLHRERMERHNGDHKSWRRDHSDA